MSISFLIPDPDHPSLFTACGEVPGNYWLKLHSFNVEKQEDLMILAALCRWNAGPKYLSLVPLHLAAPS